MCFLERMEEKKRKTKRENENKTRMDDNVRYCYQLKWHKNQFYDNFIIIILIE